MARAPPPFVTSKQLFEHFKRSFQSRDEREQHDETISYEKGEDAQGRAWNQSTLMLLET
jgi:hypothetical protein